MWLNKAYLWCITNVNMSQMMDVYATFAHRHTTLSCTNLPTLPQLYATHFFMMDVACTLQHFCLLLGANFGMV